MPTQLWYQDDTESQQTPVTSSHPLPAKLIGQASALNDQPLRTETGWDYVHITTNTTTVVMTGPGILGAIVIGTTAASTITVYDNTSAIAPVLGILKASVVEGEYYRGVRCKNGLTIVTAGSPDITILFRQY